MLLPCGNLIGLLFCLLHFLLSILFLNLKYVHTKSFKEYVDAIVLLEVVSDFDVGELTQICMADGVKCFPVHSTEEVALFLARRLGVMESVETDEHREKDDKEVDKDGLQTSECRERNSVEESKKDSESAGTGNTDSPETVDKHADRSEDSAVISEKDASKDSANKKASKAAAKYPTRKVKIGGMGDKTQALVAELSEAEKLTVLPKRRLGIGTRSMGNETH